MMAREEASVLLKMMFAFWANTHERTNVEMEMALNLALSALRPVSRERVEKAWRGEWEFDAAATEGEFGGIRCSKCHTAVSFGGKHAFHNAKTFEHFCSHCGAPMTDEAVEMVMERMEALYDTEN